MAIAADETERIEKERRENKVLPLVEMGITEAQALQYCYDRGIYGSKTAFVYMKY